MRTAASQIAGMVFALATAGFLTSLGTARAQLGKPGAAPEPGAEPVRALLQVDPPSGKDVAVGADALWQRTIATHVTLLREPGLLRSVVASDEVRNTGWYGQFKGDGTEGKAAAALARALIVRPVQDTSLIEVRPMIEPAAIATVIANAVCEQYLSKLEDQKHGRLNREVDLLQKQLNMVRIELNEEIIKEERQKQQELGSEGVVPAAKPDADPVFSALAVELQELVRARLAAEKDRDVAKRAVEGGADQGGAAAKAALQDAEERLKQLSERQDRLQATLGKVNQTIGQLNQLIHRESELRGQQNKLNERLSNLLQVELQRPGASVRIAARAMASP
jgi:hypothetical protein